jgi:hypothetical protein
MTGADASPLLPHTPVQPTQSDREWLGVLVLSTGILQNHASNLSEEDRHAQLEIMHEAAAQLDAARTARLG